jgi:protein TonB
LIQPRPTLPDDLRENNLQATALARFLIHTDGSVEVTLLKPTTNPRLNQLLLESLRKWRFFPAMKDGKVVESHQDVRVQFNVD